MSKFDLSTLEPGHEVRITDIEGNHYTIIATSGIEVEGENGVVGVVVFSNHPSQRNREGILPSGHMTSRYVEINEFFDMSSVIAIGPDGTSPYSDVLVWSYSVI